MSEWQPIETAPKDGAPLLLWVPDMTGWQAGPWRGAWSFLWNQWSLQTAIQQDGKNLVSVGEPQPTHWMPLPDAPKQ